MVLTDTRNNVDIGSIPSYCTRDLDSCIRYLGGEIIGRYHPLWGEEGWNPLWSEKGDNVIINGKRYRYEDLAIMDRLVTDHDICDMFKRATSFLTADTYVNAVSLSLRFTDPFSLPLQTNPVINNQMRILWHVANDPFQTLLDNAGLTPERCSDRFAIDGETMQGWLSGNVPVPPYVRLMIAEATGLLTLRNLA